MARLASKTQRITLFVLQDGKCAICDDELPEHFEVDHIKPWINKGRTELWNLQALCFGCHLDKTRAQGSNRYLMDWRRIARN